MEEVTEEILDELEKIGYHCRATAMTKPCCGDFILIDYDPEPATGFRIQVNDSGIELLQLVFKNIVVSWARMSSAEMLINTIKYCKQLDS